MMGIKNPTGVLLLISLLGTGTGGDGRDAVFVYSRLGHSVLLPCTSLVGPDCSLVSWIFEKRGEERHVREVSGGKVRAESDKSSRMSVTSNCSLRLCDLKVDDAGSYACLNQASVVTDVYLSLLTVTTLSKMSDLQPGGSLALTCTLFTFYDTGNCGPYSSTFSLSWVAEDGAVLPKESRYQLISHTRCNITLVTKLQWEDRNRKWRCQVNTTGSSRVVFQDFTSVFLLQNHSTAQNPNPSPTVACTVQLPISRILLCVTLPVLVLTVGFFTWRADKRAKIPAVDIELQEIR